MKTTLSIKAKSTPLGDIDLFVTLDATPEECATVGNAMLDVMLGDEPQNTNGLYSTAQMDRAIQAARPTFVSDADWELFLGRFWKQFTL